MMLLVSLWAWETQCENDTVPLGLGFLAETRAVFVTMTEGLAITHALTLVFFFFHVFVICIYIIVFSFSREWRVWVFRPTL